MLGPQDEIRAEDLPEEYRLAVRTARGASRRPPGLARPRRRRREALTMDEIERRAIIQALEKTGGNRTQAAEMLGIGLRTLQRKLKEYRMAGKADGELIKLNMARRRNGTPGWRPGIRPGARKPAKSRV